MNELCARCNICNFMPEQEEPRTLRYWWGAKLEPQVDEQPVLVIDDCPDKRDVLMALEVARDLLRGSDFVYTNTIRCDYMPGELSEEQKELASSRCAVWTHNLLENRLLILSTKTGLKQMQLGEDKIEGEIWRNHRVGVVLCIPPLSHIVPSTIPHFQMKIERVLKKRELE